MRTAVLFALTLALSGVVTATAGGMPQDRELPEPDPGARLPDEAGDDAPDRIHDDAPMPERVPGMPRPQEQPRTCESIEAEAQALLDEARTCTTDQGCEVLSFGQLLGPDSCVAAFQCSTAVSANFDRAAFLELAAPLVTEKRECGQCATAACQPPTELGGACVEGQCQLLPR